MAISSSLANMASYAPKPGTSQWTKAWQDAWLKANPGKTPPWQGVNPGVAPKPLYPVASPGGTGGAAPAASQSPLVAAEKMPWDAQYERAVGGINTSLQGALAGLANDENALGADFGVKFDRNGGQLTNFRLDPSNPFSRAALLQRAYQQRQKGTTNSLAAQGQLYSGAHQRQQNEAAFDNQQGSDRLLKDFGGLARQIVERRQAAQAAAASGIADAGWDRLNALSNQPTPAAPAAPSPAGTTNPGTAAPNDLTALISRYGAQNVKLTDRGLFYKRPSDNKWIPVK